MLISWAVTTKQLLIFAFVLVYAKSWLSVDVAHFKSIDVPFFASCWPFFKF